MSKDKKPLPFKYEWLKMVMSLDHKKFGNFKTIAYWIADHMYGDNLTCNPGINLLSKESGIPKSTAIRALNIGVEAGWLSKREGGGRNANGDGISTSYCCIVPSHGWDSMDEATVSKTLTYCLKLKDLLSQKEGATVPWVGLESFLNRSSDLQKKLDAGAGQTDRKKEREQIPSPSLDPSSDAETESEPDSETSSTSPTETARASLPVATAAQRAAWDGAWPDEDETVNPVADNAPKDFYLRRITYDALELLGYADSDPAPEESGVKYRDAWLKSLLPSDAVDEMAARKMAGTLTAGDIANVLASLDVTPKAQKRQEAIREA